MFSTTLRIAVSRNVRDVYLNRRYKVEARFPGGRTILKAQASTKQRAFKASQKAAAPQTSPTAAGGSVSYASDPQAATGVAGGGGWQQWNPSNTVNQEQ